MDDKSGFKDCSMLARKYPELCYQIHVWSSEHALVQHWDDAGGDDVTRSTDVTWEDVERVKPKFNSKKLFTVCKKKLFVKPKS